MNQMSPPNQTDVRQALGLTAARRRNHWLKRIVWIVGAVVLAALAYWYFFAGAGDQTELSYDTTPATVSDLVITASATGTIQPLTQVDVGSELSGIVAEVLVDENDVVTSGQVLARLDVTRLAAQIDNAKAKLRIAEAGVSLARATARERGLNLDRQKKLGIQGLVPTEQVDTALAEADRADASLASAESQVAAAQADLAAISVDFSNSEIVTPIDGVVLKRSVEPGQTVASSLQAPVLFQIAQDLRRIQLEAQVDEADIGMVREGQRATFAVDAYRTREFPAVIEKLSFAPEEIEGVVTYKAVLSAPNDDLALRPGMTATAKIVVEEFKQALSVPNEALRYQPPRQAESQGFSVTQLFMPRFPRNQRGKRDAGPPDERSVYVLRNGAPAEVKVKVGASDGQRTLIKDGDLNDGDEVITAQRAQGGARR
jgi:HlyD family secretion protein